MNDRSGKLEKSVPRRNAPRYTSDAKHLTRYAHDKARPESTSQLTRYTQEHAREEFEDIPMERSAAYLQEVAPAPAAPRPPVAAPPAPPRPTAPPQQALPRTEAVPPVNPQPLRGTQADLYSDAPITISVLQRALPQRFAKIKARKTDGRDSVVKNGKQLGLTHAIRPLKSLFSHTGS